MTYIQVQETGHIRLQKVLLRHEVNVRSVLEQGFNHGGISHCCCITNVPIISCYFP